jgi:tyrosine-protein phosphatase YwqE
MFGLWNKKKQLASPEIFARLGADMHSHLLPGIDDGSPDLDHSVLLIKGLMALGYKRLITTPHIYPDLYPNTPETIAQAYALLKNRLSEEQIDIDIHYAAEYFIDDFFRDRLQKGQELLTIQQNKILVEVSFISPPQEFHHVLFDLVTGGYQPIIAHPERYSYYHHDKEVYHRFRDQGCLLQMNLLSITGYYGRPVQMIAEYLLEEGLIDLIGTDMHHPRHLDALQNNLFAKDLEYILASGNILNSSL